MNDSETSLINRLAVWIRRHWVMLVILLVLVLIFNFIATHSFLQVTVAGDGLSGDITYNLLNQASSKPSEFSSKSMSISRLVKRGSYEVLVTNGDKSSFVVVNTGGFFSTKKVLMKVSSEKYRAFVGNNPGSCMYYAGSVLYSYYCNDTFNHVAEHVPASSSLPTYKLENTSTKLNGTVEGVASTQSGTFMLIRSPASEDTRKPLHTVYAVGGGFYLKNGIALTNLDNTKQYTMQKFNQGFIVYDSSFSSVFYYSSPSSRPLKINMPTPKEKNMKQASYGISDSTLVVAYSDKTGFDSYDNPKKLIGTVKSEFTIYQNGHFKDVTLTQNLKKYYTTVEPCSNMICLVGDGQLFVYDTSSTTLKLSYMVTGVDNLFANESGTLVVRSGEVFNLDVAKATGYKEYTFGAYKYCGIQGGQNNYTLCVTDSKGKAIALQIDENKNITDPIDQQVAGLADTHEVQGVSAYRNYIFVTPNLTGSLVYSSAIGGYDYNPVAKKSAADAINQKVKDLGINTKIYRVINTAGN